MEKEEKSEDKALAISVFPSSTSMSSSLSGSKILIVEDEPHLAYGLSFNLEQEGVKTLMVSDGLSALDVWENFAPDMIVLDLMLPNLSGLEVLEKIRSKSEKIPILILSAKNQLQDKIQGFSLGADDYLTKPFHLEEFICRVERLIKHSAWYHQNQENQQKYQTPSSESASLQREDNLSINCYQFGNNKINFDTNYTITANGEFRLTEQELKLLKIFISNPDKIISKKRLLAEGWGYHEEIATRTLDIFIGRLRKYFEKDPKRPKHFISVRNQGMVFHPNANNK